MRYFGGKTRTCKEIAKVIESYRKQDQLFISPFVGGAWVESLISSPKICYDKHKYLIAMYLELQKGWIPPDILSKEEYNYVKNNQDEKPYLTGFVGFGCSFAGKWFGGYAKDNTNRNYCLNAKNSILKKMRNLMDCRFECRDYKDLSFEDSIIYCDPPYADTTSYCINEVGEFNSHEFWGIMRKWSEKNLVIVSEYDGPKGVQCIWEKPVKLDIRDANNLKKSRIEKLFLV
jgi:DNA adenine methylase